MVNNLNLQPPASDSPSDDERKIQGGPLYPLSEVQDNVREYGRIFLVTRDCRRDVENRLGWSTDDVGQLVLELSDRDYRNSEWCKSSISKWLPCDAYTIRRSEHINASGISVNCEYYLKFAIGPDGTALLFVSCHLSN